MLITLTALLKDVIAYVVFIKKVFLSDSTPV